MDVPGVFKKSWLIGWGGGVLPTKWAEKFAFTIFRDGVEIAGGPGP